MLCVHALPLLAQDDNAPLALLPLLVTGERVQLQLEQTYQGVSVVNRSAAALNTAGATLNEVIRTTPNTFVQGPSELPTIRGVQGGGAGGLNSAAITGVPSRLPVIVDGIMRIPSLVNRSYTSLWDVQQVEVLRGPQSLLRGRTGIAGAVIVNTGQPTDYFVSTVQAGVAVNQINDPQYTLNTLLSGPLGPDLQGRLTLEMASGDDPREVQNHSAAFITEYDQLRLRGKLTGALSSATDWMLLAEHDRGQAPQTRNFVDTPALTGHPYADRIIRANSPTRAFDSEASLLAFKTNTASTSTNNTLETITSWSRDQFDSIPEQLFPSFLSADERLLTFDALYHFDFDIPPAAELAGLIGFGFEDRHQRFSAQGIPLQADIAVESRTYAVYTDLRYGLTDTLALLAGMRLQNYHDERDIATTALLPPPVGPQMGSTAGDGDEVVLLPKLGIAWQVSPDHSLGATIRRGYTPGGASINAFSATPYQYDSETVWTTELTWHNRPRQALRLGLTLFHNHFINPQVYGAVVPGNRLSLQVFNQLRGRSYGAEFELDWQATQRVGINASLGLLETQISAANPARTEVEGNSFGQDPNLTASLGLNWQVTPHILLYGQTTYVGEAYNDFNNTPGSEIGDYTLTNVGATWQLGPAQLRLYANNLFNETGLTGRVTAAGAFITAPREIGLTATIPFD